jgi:ribosomal protein S17
MVQGKLIGQVISAKMQRSVVVKVPYWHVISRLQVRSSASARARPTRRCVCARSPHRLIEDS